MKFVINNKTINIVDAPATGTEGQVLTIDANGNPKWDDTSDMSNYYTKSEINEMIPENNLTNIVDGSTSGSVRGINTKSEDSSYKMGNNAWAEGLNTMASGESSHAEGDSTTASAEASHAEGCSTTASGQYAHAEGNETTASKAMAHAEGYLTTASGNTSHAEGYYTTASGDYSHTEGFYTIAQRKSQHVFGEYNITDTNGTQTTKGNYIEIVGNGTSQSVRSNARTLDWSGNEVLAGKLTVGINPTTNMDVATKQYVDSAISNYALKSEIPTVTNDFTDAYKDKVDSLWEDYQDAITALG